MLTEITKQNIKNNNQPKPRTKRKDTINFPMRYAKEERDLALKRLTD